MSKKKNDKKQEKTEFKLSKIPGFPKITKEFLDGLSWERLFYLGIDKLFGYFDEEEAKLIDEAIEKMKEEMKVSERRAKIYRSYPKKGLPPDELLDYPEYYKVCTKEWSKGVCNEFNEKKREVCWECHGEEFRELNEEDIKRLEVVADDDYEYDQVIWV